MEKEIERVGHADVEAVERVLADCRAHPGGYDPLKVCVYKDGTGEIRSGSGVRAAISFEDFS